ncbi:MAG: DUF2007 domain-containing protein [Christensenellaceae bacterium]|nr:DUF2007 domain-containing protein [Christensenellaceae bacterium]
MHTCHYCGHEFDEQLERCPQCTGWVRPQSPKPPVTYYPSDAASFVRLTTAANPTEAQLIAQALYAAGIPCRRKPRGEAAYLKAYAGQNHAKEDIYVDPLDIEDAAAVLGIRPPESSLPKPPVVRALYIAIAAFVLLGLVIVLAYFFSPHT